MESPSVQRIHFDVRPNRKLEKVAKLFDFLDTDNDGADADDEVMSESWTSTPTWAQFERAIEEIAHLEQFLNNWANLPKQNDLQEIGNRGQTQPIIRSPDYDALISWAKLYLDAYRTTPAGQNGYADNAIEKPAKLRR